MAVSIFETDVSWNQSSARISSDFSLSVKTLARSVTIPCSKNISICLSQNQSMLNHHFPTE
jgi:hypothetical protein